MATEQTIELKEKPAPDGRPRVETKFEVHGMTCGNCARHVTEAIRSVQGVQSATVSLDTHQASVRWAPDAQPDTAAVERKVKAAGYEANVAKVHPHNQSENKLANWQITLWIGVIGTALMMIGEWVFGLAMERWFQWFSLIIASVVQVFAGAPFYRGAWRQLKAGSSNMDTLVALGSSAAFAYSTWALLSGTRGHVYFMEAASIIALISVGHWMEARVSVRASSALQGLLNLAPAIAHRRNADGTASEVPVAELKPGDLVALRPGDRVPTDGEAVEGDSAVDESMLTGESNPVDKTPRNQLYAGTVNLNGVLIMRVTAVGEETALAHIIEAVQRAQTSRANIQRLGDRVSSIFVPAVVAVALAAALWWGLAPESANHIHTWLAQFLWPAHPPQGPLEAAIIIASAVLIIACPCAMGLATPAAIMAGSNAAAQRGILIRDGVALEKAGTITAVLFDKTGTLTVGKPSVVKVWENREKVHSPQSTVQSQKAEGGNPKAEIRRPKSESELSPGVTLAAGLARHSNHPISQAVARLSSERLEVKDWKEIRGKGVQGKVQSPESKVQSRDGEQLARLGSLRWLGESGVSLEEGKMFIDEWSAQGATIVGLAVEKSLCALFAVKDTVKTGASAVIGRLQRQGLKTYLVTGDNSRSAGSIASQAGILPEHVFAEVRPEEKAELVKKLQHNGERVAFVGDGINDAPALEQADLGIAVSRASDIAREAADIILLKSEIEAVPESLGLARATLRTIKQNLFWAFFYNAVGVPLAALGFMSPVLCAAAMGLSDLVVIGNALRLRRWKL